MPQCRCLPLFRRPVPAHCAPVLYKYHNYTKTQAANQYESPGIGAHRRAKGRNPATKMPRCGVHHGGKRQGKWESGSGTVCGQGGARAPAGASAGGRPPSAGRTGLLFWGKSRAGEVMVACLGGVKRRIKIKKVRGYLCRHRQAAVCGGRDGQRSACRRTWPRADGRPPGGGTVWAGSGLG